MYEADKDFWDLQEEDSLTGIRDKLKKNNKNFYTLKALWAKEKPDLKTNYKVIYYFVPSDKEQCSLDYGWVTVENLELWCYDVGPLAKNKKNFKDFILNED